MDSICYKYVKKNILKQIMSALENTRALYNSLHAPQKNPCMTCDKLGISQKPEIMES